MNTPLNRWKGSQEKKLRPVVIWLPPYLTEYNQSQMVVLLPQRKMELGEPQDLALEEP